jgi:hypothetical protein
LYLKPNPLLQLFKQQVFHVINEPDTMSEAAMRCWPAERAQPVASRAIRNSVCLTWNTVGYDCECPIIPPALPALDPAQVDTSRVPNPVLLW